MSGVLAIIYGLACYIAALLAIAYAVGFVGDFGVPKALDDGPRTDMAAALLIDFALLGIFAIQHSGMARQSFKAAWLRVVPAPVERSTYVLFSSLVLGLLYWQWRPLAEPALWHVTTPWPVLLLWLLYGTGWFTVLASTFLINHFSLFGLSQVMTYGRHGETPPPEFRTPLFYRLVRHPLYLGFIIAFWSTPRMSLGHFVFALTTTAYVLIAIQLEEHDLVALFGEKYRAYQRGVSMIVPWFPHGSH